MTESRDEEEGAKTTFPGLEARAREFADLRPLNAPNGVAWSFNAVAAFAAPNDVVVVVIA